MSRALLVDNGDRPRSDVVHHLAHQSSIWAGYVSTAVTIPAQMTRWDTSLGSGGRQHRYSTGCFQRLRNVTSRTDRRGAGVNVSPL